MPTLAEVFARAVQSHQSGDLEQADRLYRQLLQVNPDHADAHHLFGVLACQTGRHHQAVTSIRQAVALNPHAAVYHANLGVAYEALGHFEDAAASYQQALHLRHEDADSHYNLANVLRRQHKLPEAVAQYHEALRLRPDYPQAHCNLGLTLAAQGLLREATVQYRQGLQQNPAAAEIYNNLGIALAELGLLDEAIAHHREALRIDSTFAPAHHGLGAVLQQQNQLAEAMRCYQRAVELKQDYADARWNRSLLWLLQGDFSQGWPEYEWRWTQPNFIRRPGYQPLWDGSALGGKTILLYGEQGLGDTIQFIRYVPMVKERGGSVIFECQAPLVQALSWAALSIRPTTYGSAVPAFEVQAPLASLPGIFRTTPDSIPASIPYTFADPRLVEEWRRKLILVKGLKIGIAWQGNPAHRADRTRSIPLRLFGRLTGINGIHLVSLQKGPGRDQIGPLARQFAILDPAGDLDEAAGPFMDTSAIMMNLDIVVTSDTAVAHLAGALGVPVWVALPLVPDWRWLLEREDCPWYPTMRLFRQTRLAQWDDVFERIGEELKKARDKCRGQS